MKKRDELQDPKSCWNKAKEDEVVFVLLERDDAAPETIRFWINTRIGMGKNKAGDNQMVEAERCANRMEDNRKAERLLKEKIALAVYEAVIDLGRGVRQDEVLNKFGVTEDIINKWTRTV